MLSAADQQPQTTTSVGDWGRCADCDGLTRGEPFPFDDGLTYQCDSCKGALWDSFPASAIPEPEPPRVEQQVEDHAAPVRCDDCGKADRVEDSIWCEACLDACCEQALAEAKANPQAGIAATQFALRTMTPESIVVLTEKQLRRRGGPQDPKTAVMVVPNDFSRSAKRTAPGVAGLVMKFIQKGYSLELALCRLAAGRDVVNRELQAMGVKMDRKTVAAGLKELCGPRGPLGKIEPMTDWVDIHAAGTKDDPVQKTGAFRYRVKVSLPFFEDLAEAVARIESLLAHTHVGGATPIHAAIGGITGSHRARKCLQAAIRLAKEGQRSHLGHWLTMRGIDSGLNIDQTMALMTEYQRSVPRSRPGNLPYRLRDAMATVRSAYKHHSGTSA
jgi:hypothetical protein